MTEIGNRRAVQSSLGYSPQAIEEGGLNIKNLEAQNICLLLKFIQKLHTANNNSWAKWIHSSIYRGRKQLGDKVSVCSNS
jgi:hypothetical protein